MAPPFHVYWYETDNGPPPAELAPLALAVDGIVIPTRKLDATFFVDPTTIASPIASKTIRSPGYGDISDWVIAGQPVPKSFASLREVALRHAAQDQQCVGDAHAESVMQDFSSWCFAQYGLEFFMEHASFNNGLLIGKQPLPALDLFSRADGLQRAQAALNQWLLVLFPQSQSRCRLSTFKALSRSRNFADEAPMKGLSTSPTYGSCSTTGALTYCRIHRLLTSKNGPTLWRNRKFFPRSRSLSAPSNTCSPRS